MNYNIFLFSGNCAFITLKKGQGLQTLYLYLMRAKWTIPPKWSIPPLQSGAYSPISVVCSTSLTAKLVQMLGCQRLGGQCMTYWNRTTISYNTWIITLGLQLKYWPGIVLAFESQLNYTILNDLFVEPVLRKENWKRLVQRGRVESAWWKKYK